MLAGFGVICSQDRSRRIFQFAHLCLGDQKWKIGISQQPPNFMETFKKKEDNLSCKTISHGIQPSEWKIGISQQTLVGSFPNLKLRLRGQSQMLWKIKMKMTFHGRQPQKWKIGISQQPLVRSYPNLKLRLRGPSQMLWKLKMKMTFHGRPPQKWEIGISQQPLVKMKSRNISAASGLNLSKFEI